MKVREILQFVDEVRPNPYDERQKTQGLSDCEGMVQAQVFLLAPEEMVFYQWPEDGETELLVQAPHDKLYRGYLYAMIDFMNGEYGKYQNSMQMFNSDFSEFVRWFADAYRPADTWTEEEGYGGF